MIWSYCMANEDSKSASISSCSCPAGYIVCWTMCGVPVRLLQPQFLLCKSIGWVWVTFQWQWCAGCIYTHSGSPHNIMHSSSYISRWVAAVLKEYKKILKNIWIIENLGMASCHTQPLKKAKKQGEMILPSLSPSIPFNLAKGWDWVVLPLVSELFERWSMTGHL